VRLFVVERSVPGLTISDLELALRALAESSRRVGRGRVRHVRTTFLPAQSRCICLFESESIDLVRLVNATAQFPFTLAGQAIPHI
jgi:hypothetical protein